ESLRELPHPARSGAEHSQGDHLLRGEIELLAHREEALLVGDHHPVDQAPRLAAGVGAPDLTGEPGLGPVTSPSMSFFSHACDNTPFSRHLQASNFYVYCRPRSQPSLTTRRGIRMSESPNGVRSADNGIEAEGLVREFKGDIRAVDGIDLAVRPGE